MVYHCNPNFKKSIHTVIALFFHGIHVHITIMFRLNIILVSIAILSLNKMLYLYQLLYKLDILDKWYYWKQFSVEAPYTVDVYKKKWIYWVLKIVANSVWFIYFILWRNSNTSVWGPSETTSGGPSEIPRHWGITTEKHWCHEGGSAGGKYQTGLI